MAETNLPDDGTNPPIHHDRGPALLYVTAGSLFVREVPVSIYVDRGDPFSDMDPRERALCAALLRLALEQCERK